MRAVQYRHAPDESPLLVLRHYTSQLRAQGFTLVDVCDAPCRTSSGLEDENAPWDRELDPTRRLDQRAFGDRGAYVIGYRHDALVAVRVGLWDLDVTSTVKDHPVRRDRPFGDRALRPDAAHGGDGAHRVDADCRGSPRQLARDEAAQEVTNGAPLPRCGSSTSLRRRRPARGAPHWLARLASASARSAITCVAIGGGSGFVPAITSAM